MTVWFRRMSLKEKQFFHFFRSPCFSHPNLIRLLDVSLEPTCVQMVFELAEMDLSTYLRSQSGGIPEKMIWCLGGQLLAGLEYMHAMGCMHRDLKPQNLLLMGTRTLHPALKIADFGLARFLSEPVQLYSFEMVTLWYRPPELLLESNEYGPEVDMWAVGCILAELSTRAVLFPGKDVDDQLQHIVHVLGRPSEREWPALPTLPGYLKLPPAPPRLESTLEQALFPMREPGVRFVAECFRFHPSDRITAAQALKDKLFQ